MSGFKICEMKVYVESIIGILRQSKNLNSYIKICTLEN